MTHSDDDGLVLPPRIAPIQVVIIPIFSNDQERMETFAFADEIVKRLQSRLEKLKVKIDTRDDIRPAEKFFHWLQQGIPLRIEVGPRDVAKRAGMVARRDIRDKQLVPLEQITQHVMDLMDEIQLNLFRRALDFQKSNTRRAQSYSEFREILEQEGGFILAHWNGSEEVEDKIKTDTKATIRCVPFQNDSIPGKCIVTGEASSQEALFGIAY